MGFRKAIAYRYAIVKWLTGRNIYRDSRRVNRAAERPKQKELKEDHTAGALRSI